MYKVIIACDFSTEKELTEFLKKFKDEQLFLKLGYEIIYSCGLDIIDQCQKLGHRIFLDLKLHDIPNTVAAAVKNLSKYNVDFITLHAAGGSEMMKAARDACTSKKTKLLAVTQLTSINQSMMTNELLITRTIDQVVGTYAKNAANAGIDGVICSAQEAAIIKATIAKDFLMVTPGIRLENTEDDQKRVATPAQARLNGANYIVVGRPITGEEDPVAVYNLFVKEFK